MSIQAVRSLTRRADSPGTGAGGGGNCACAPVRLIERLTGMATGTFW